MRWLPLWLLVLFFGLPGFLWAHPHEFVDWGAGLSVAPGKPLTINEVELQLTWDEIFSALMLSDFPGITSGHLSPADLAQLHSTYGLSSDNRPFSLTVTFNGTPLSSPLTLKGATTDGTKVTLIYVLSMNLAISADSQLRVELYDPTYYTDMGVRGQNGAYFLHASPAQLQHLSFQYKQDFQHPYYYDQVFPQAIEFHLTP